LVSFIAYFCVVVRVDAQLAYTCRGSMWNPGSGSSRPITALRPRRIDAL